MACAQRVNRRSVECKIGRAKQRFRISSGWCRNANDATVRVLCVCGQLVHRSIGAEPTRRGREKERAAHSAHVTVHRRQKTLSAVITKSKSKHCVDKPKALHHQLECLHLDEPLSSAGPNEASTNSKASRRVALAEARVNCDSRAVVFSSVFSTYTSAAFAQQLRGYGTWKRRTQPRPRHAFASPPLSRQRDSGHDLRSPNRRLGTATTKVGMQLTRNSLFSMRPARSFGNIGLAPSGAVRPRLRLRATKVRLSGSSLAAWVRDEGLRATPVGSARLNGGGGGGGGSPAPVSRERSVTIPSATATRALAIDVSRSTSRQTLLLSRPECRRRFSRCASYRASEQQTSQHSSQHSEACP